MPARSDSDNQATIHAQDHTNSAQKNENNTFTKNQTVASPSSEAGNNPFTVAVDTGHAQGSKSRFVVENNPSSQLVDVNFRGVSVTVGSTDSTEHAGGATFDYLSPTGTTGQYLRFWEPGEGPTGNIMTYFGMHGDLVLGVGGLSSSALQVKARADAESRFKIDENGALNWGPGGGTAPDTTLYRTAANAIQTDDVLRGKKGTPTYSASITPNATDGEWQTITVTNGTAFTINAPTNPPDSTHTQELTIEIFNNSGGAMGAVTWNAAFVFSGTAFVNPANTKKRFIAFTWNGASWIETSGATADY